MLGGNVCYHHGGAAPQVRAKAKRRLEQASDALVQRLLQFAMDGGVDDNVALRAIRDALDRAGMAAKTELAVKVKQEPWEELLGDVVHVTKQQHEAWKRGEFTSAPAEPPRALPPADDPANVVDAEIVENPHESPPRSTGATRDGADPPEWAEPAPASRTSQLVPLEDAMAEVNRANRAAKVGRVRRAR